MYKSLEKLLNGVRQAYIDDQIAKKIRASGKSAESLKIEITETGGQISGVKYFVQQKIGRRPGKFPLIDDILDWIRVKKITPRDTKTTLKQLAFLFARKIAQSGTDIFQGIRPGLDPSEAIDILIESFIKEFTKEKSKEIINELKLSVA